MTQYVFPPAQQAAIGIVGSDQYFPVHRIYCVGQNYAKHAQEMGHSGRDAPFFFSKPADSIVYVPEGTTGQAAYPGLTENLHYEAELVIAIGKGGHSIAPEDAQAHIFGYAVGVDLTRRDLQAALKKAGRPWCIAKGFDQSAPIGPIVPKDQAGDVEHLAIGLDVNGQVRQAGNTDELIWKLGEVIAHISQGWELQAGDLIFTGTPAGVGPIEKGETLRAHIQGLPDLTVTIV